MTYPLAFLTACAMVVTGPWEAVPKDCTAAAIAWCDDHQGHKWVEGGASCHPNILERKSFFCGYTCGKSKTLYGSVCIVPHGFHISDTEMTP